MIKFSFFRLEILSLWFIISTLVRSSAQMKKTETWTLQYLKVLTTQKGLKVIHVKLNRNCTPHGQKYVDTTFPMLWCSSSCFLFCCTPWVQWGEVLYNQVLYVSHLQNVISLKTSQLCFFHTGLKPRTLEWKFFDSSLQGLCGSLYCVTWPLPHLEVVV